jgi:HK97 family phage major capsid protein
MAAFGDFSYYHIGDREAVSIKVARETFLANNQTGYFGFARHDGKASLLDAFRHFEIKGSA